MVSSVVSILFLLPPPPPPSPLQLYRPFPFSKQVKLVPASGPLHILPRKPLHLLLCFSSLHSQLTGRLPRRPSLTTGREISCRYFKALMTLTLCLFTLQLFLFCHPLLACKLPEGGAQARLVHRPVSGQPLPPAQRCWQAGPEWRGAGHSGVALTRRQTWNLRGPTAQMSRMERNAGGWLSLPHGDCPQTPGAHESVHELVWADPELGSAPRTGAGGTSPWGGHGSQARKLLERL